MSLSLCRKELVRDRGEVAVFSFASFKAVTFNPPHTHNHTPLATTVLINIQLLG